MARVSWCRGLKAAVHAAARRQRRVRLDQFPERFSREVVEGVGNLEGTSDGRHVLLVPVDPQSLVDGGEDVADADLALHDERPPVIAPAHNRTGLQAPATERDGPALGPMVPAQTGIEVGSPAELSHDQHHGRIVEAPFAEVVDKGGKGAVQRRRQAVPVSLVVLAVGIPGIAVKTGRGDEPAARLHQTPGQQHALPHRIAPIHVARLFRLLGQVEGIAHLGRQDHLPGLVHEGVHAGVLQAFHPLSVDPVHRVQEQATILQHGRTQRLGQGQVRDLEILLGGVRDGHGHVIRPQERGTEEILVLAVALPTRDDDVRRQSVGRSHLLGHDGPQAGKLHGRIVAVARDGVVDRLGMVVAERLDGTNQRQLVHPLGQPGQQLRDLDAVDVGGNGAEGTVGLGVPGVDLAGTSLQPHQNAGLGLRLGQICAGRLESRLELQELAQMGAQKPQRADPDEVTPTPVTLGSS